ncbi:MAG: nucleotidyltransferase substrate binding protein [Clostridia bacterium]|nr:nucleotidyltransferase substrate binding protein [Clostridia bacterium]MDD4047329.1 nucleotidyltransferase substrate binding protein [Clostridia bacterium]
MSKLKAKISNFRNALRRLKEATLELEKSNASDVVRDGVIRRFEFTYELAWKMTKEYLEDLGITDNNSPKAVIKEAFAQKLIFNEEIWLLMLKDRNMTTHVYKEEMAQEIADRIKKSYVKEFVDLYQQIKSE